ncbi:serine/arginine repetitive matrix protein 1 [Streptomyces purpurascens]|uniref:serine/arginine repetitive matrix protein 1 n=1 Tax=Streptomyces purpurascens TaxID=1924 RepID=UPI00167C2BF6|nr:serine/arginine repetitive matrix protein 1 [Streptomyces purpurascens]MCE7051934.1 serine/arginine repetitive matrix protein 1 [Streptomyces purpurascens]
MTSTDEHQEGGGAIKPTEAGSRARRLVWTRTAPSQLDFPLVRNGLDYLTSVVEHLDETESEVTARDVKYAVLHLQAAVEVLLKARLMAEHWSLVFSRPEDATRKALEEATLSSVSTDHAVTRLRNIAAVPITAKEEKALTGLGKHRNKLQHFGLTAPARAVEAKAGEVLDFLIRFVDEELLLRLGPAERQEAERTLRGLRGGLANINTFVKERTNRIRGEVKKEDAENRTIQCPDCDQMALVLGETADSDAEPAAPCRFCSSRWEPEELLSFFRAEGQDEPNELNTCPQCGEWMLGWGVRILNDLVGEVSFCFACAVAFPALAPCDRCGRPTNAADGSTGLCGSCWEDAVEETRYGREDPTDYG